MSHYAELNADALVVNVIIADAEFVATHPEKIYIKYTNHNEAGIGWTYDYATKLFVPPVVPPLPPPPVIEP